MLTEVYPDSF